MLTGHFYSAILNDYISTYIINKNYVNWQQIIKKVKKQLSICIRIKSHQQKLQKLLTKKHPLAYNKRNLN